MRYALKAMDETPHLGPCPLCGRPLVPGPSVDRHHWVPRSSASGRKGKKPKGEPADQAWDWLHKICHRMVHRTFSEKELANDYASAAAVLTHPDIETFVAWVRRKPPEYVDWPRNGR